MQRWVSVVSFAQHLRVWRQSNRCRSIIFIHAPVGRVDGDDGVGWVRIVIHFNVRRVHAQFQRFVFEECWQRVAVCHLLVFFEGDEASSSGDVAVGRGRHHPTGRRFSLWSTIQPFSPIESFQHRRVHLLSSPRVFPSFPSPFYSAWRLPFVGCDTATWFARARPLPVARRCFPLQVRFRVRFLFFPFDLIQ